MHSSSDFYRQASPSRARGDETRCDSPQYSSGNDPSPGKGDVDEELQDVEDDNDDSDACNRQNEYKDARPRKPHLQVEQLDEIARTGPLSHQSMFLSLFNKNAFLQGRFSGRLETKTDEKRLAEECKLLGPLLGGSGKRGERSRLTLAKIVRGIASGEVRRHCEGRERKIEVEPNRHYDLPLVLGVRTEHVRSLTRQFIQELLTRLELSDGQGNDRLELPVGSQCLKEETLNGLPHFAVSDSPLTSVSDQPGVPVSQSASVREGVRQ